MAFLVLRLSPSDVSGCPALRGGRHHALVEGPAVNDGAPALEGLRCPRGPRVRGEVELVADTTTRRARRSTSCSPAASKGDSRLGGKRGCLRQARPAAVDPARLTLPRSAMHAENPDRAALCDWAPADALGTGAGASMPTGGPRWPQDGCGWNRGSGLRGGPARCDFRGLGSRPALARLSPRHRGRVRTGRRWDEFLGGPPTANTVGHRLDRLQPGRLLEHPPQARLPHGDRSARRYKIEASAQTSSGSQPTPVLFRVWCNGGAGSGS